MFDMDDLLSDDIELNGFSIQLEDNQQSKDLIDINKILYTPEEHHYTHLFND